MAKSKKKEELYFLPITTTTQNYTLLPEFSYGGNKQMYWAGGNSKFNEDNSKFQGGTQSEYMESMQNNEDTGPDENYGGQESSGESGGGKGAGFMKGMGAVASTGGVGSIIGNQINEKTTDEYGRQSSINARGAGYWEGTSKGAQMGSSMGPWGMLIGAGIGGIAGGIGGAAKAKKNNKIINEEIQANAGPSQIYSANQYQYSNGGPIDNMSGYNEFNGNTHEQGGIALGKNAEVETGEVNYKNYIFSDRLGEGKSTYADQAKRIRSKYKGREDDSYAKTSMDKDLNELMIKNESHRLAKEKEDTINNHVQSLQDVNAYGGKIKCENGGLLVNEKHKKELDLVAKSRKMNVDDLIKEIHTNTQKFAVGGVYQPQDQQSNFSQPTTNTAFSTQYGTNLAGNQDEKNILTQYGNGGNKKNSYQQAQSDSLTLYNSGLNPNIPNYQYSGYSEAYLRLNELNKTPPTPLSGEQGINSQFVKPTMIPYSNQNTNKDITKKSLLYHPNYVQSIEGVEKSKFANGGFDEEDPKKKKQSSWITNQMLTDNSTAFIENPDIPLSSDNYKSANDESFNNTDQDYKLADMMNQPNVSKTNIKDSTDYSQYNLDTYNRDLAEALKRNSNTKEKTKFKFGNEEAALLASNIPALYNLGMSMKPAKTTFKKVTPELLSLQSQRDMATSQGAIAQRIALENARNVGGGSGSVLASLAASSAATNAQMMNVLRDSYQQENIQNTGIKNQAAYTNNQIANNEIIANEQNKAMADSTRGLALSDIGQNTQGYLRDKKLDKTNKKNNQQMVDIINQIAPNYQWNKDPESDKYMIQYISSISNGKQ